MTYLLVLAVVVGWLALSVLAVAVWILLRRMTIRRFRAALHGSPGIRRVTRCDVCGQPFDDPLTAVWLPPMIVAHEDCARQLQLSGEPIQAAVDPARPSAGWRRPSGTRSSPTPIRSRVLRRGRRTAALGAACGNYLQEGGVPSPDGARRYAHPLRLAAVVKARAARDAAKGKT